MTKIVYMKYYFEQIVQFCYYMLFNQNNDFRDVNCRQCDEFINVRMILFNRIYNLLRITLNVLNNNIIIKFSFYLMLLFIMIKRNSKF